MSMYLDKEMSFRQIALLLNIRPSSVSRRIRKISFELTQGEYISCMKKKKIFTRLQMTIAKDYFINRLSIKQIAERENTSFYHIRKLINEIRYTINNIQEEKL
jgi:predicted DNA-binding protein YlxM (UPF0122 family)